MKLSNSQKKVLKLLRSKGNCIHWLDGLKPRAFISNNMDFTLRTDTVFKLLDLGLIKNTGNDKYKPVYTLTPLGQQIDLK